MPDPDPPNPRQRRPGIDRRALAAAHERRVANREFVDILTSPPGLPGPPLQVRYKVDRIARSVLAANLLYQFLQVQETHTGLFLEELGREVDWDNESDMLTLNTLGSIGEFEGARIKAGTHDPFKRRWVLTGRGWPGAKRVGFKRDAGSWQVVDALQWGHIKFAHMELANSGPNGGTSIRNLRDVLEERGFKISRDKLRVLLHDRIYVDGEWTFHYEGVEYTGRKIEIPDPVPLEVYERNQRLMGVTRGKQRVNPIGHYALNRIALTHTACRHLLDKRGNPPVLRASHGSYKHKSCPLPECGGLALPHPALDALVIGTLLKLCESKELQADYEQRADRAITDNYNDEGRIATLRNRLSILKLQEARIKREWLESGLQESTLSWGATRRTPHCPSAWSSSPTGPPRTRRRSGESRRPRGLAFSSGSTTSAGCGRGWKAANRPQRASPTGRNESGRPHRCPDHVVPRGRHGSRPRVANAQRSARPRRA